MLEMEKPRIECVEKNSSNNYGRFVIEPLERGYGTTLGNSLRRVLLSSLPGAAVTSIKIDGVLHEFSTIPGVLEDTTEIILNIKKLVLSYAGNERKIIRLELQGPKEVKAADITPDAEVDILNPDLHIASLDEDGKVEIEMMVERGRGYVSADQQPQKNDEIVGLVPIDSIFTPVTRVNYTVENARVGKRTDYDRLNLEVWTNGSINPEEAISLSAQILIEYLKLFTEIDDTYAEVEILVEKEEEKKDKVLEMSIEELELSVRASNGLKRASINTVGDLIAKNREEMSKIRNLGQKSLEEIERKLKELNLSFKKSED
ncbi:MAG: DNA-directed RNA polymerase subunit alpha [Syntrophomonas sp.]|uniref:DNA-directed RNA polymerase subunit alpha n=1 Tax=Syntrophomonas sp. TaxID=2053627 RepID=UPI00260A49F4|nr:DNA-directed RNA polymerase subunit alpha [Syntrophomonas sp.]MDD2509621.1 DNA-directed RNA polymerase subunit alpha [Syntrophomonas sp.]MDD3879763.1 DNA-directed RNA polymerase subunit alpha [Syntrophomonas sp.]MDD4626268.1 DNA-directed RNA polymerase subunit alpha [Syntrophomonas sp.]